MTPATSIRDQIIQALGLLIVAVLTGLLARYRQDSNKNAAPSLQRDAVATLTMLAGTVVAATWQTTVSVLKDPERPGAWDAEAKAAARAAALRALSELGRAALDTLAAQGMNAQSRDMLLRAIIESEVARLNLTVQSAAPMVVETTIESADDHPPVDQSGIRKPS